MVTSGSASPYITLTATRPGNDLVRAKLGTLGQPGWDFFQVSHPHHLAIVEPHIHEIAIATIGFTIPAVGSGHIKHSAANLEAKPAPSC
jgi:hypothetical protein